MNRMGLIVLFTLFSHAVFAQPTITEQSRKRMDEVISVFENSTLKLQYAYIEALDDGRGYTAGRMGATTGTGDLLVVVEHYLKVNPDSEFKPLLPVLKARAKEGSDSLEGLETLPGIWKRAAKDPLFRKVQDEVEDLMIYNPTVKIVKQTPVQSVLGFLCIYDTMVQHGEVGLRAVLSHVNHSYASEKDYLIDFLAFRFDALWNSDPSTRREWRESVGRVRALRKLVIKDNFDLEGPFSIRPFGETFVIP